MRVAVTLGEPAGIGPDLCALIAEESHAVEMVIVGSADLLTQRAALLNCPLKLNPFDPAKPPQTTGRGQLSIVDIPLRAPVTPGTLNADNSPYVLDVLKAGFDLCHHHQCDALLTLPVHKAIIAQSGIPFMGHTEHFAHLAGVDNVLMSFFTPQLVLGLVTTHYALKDVPALITPKRLHTAIELLQTGLKQFYHRPNPRLGILGLNPHAGENGLLGREEIDTIIPVIQHYQSQGMLIEGPLSGDTAFTPNVMGGLDAILAMYHDQGLGPLKARFFGHIVNVTLGLPFMRISVDHGTALNKAGTRDISTQSFGAALQLLSAGAGHRNRMSFTT